MPLLKSSPLPLTALTLASLQSLGETEAAKFWAGLTTPEKAQINYRWSFWARPEQLAPFGDWRTWLILSGRGWGKTRTGAEWVRAQIETGQCRRVALVGRTVPDVRDVMVEGESGILACCPPWNKPKYEPSKRRLTWPNGAIATTYSADEPALLRGPQHDGAWADELAAWRYAEAWDQLQFGLRLGQDPRSVVTTTPRPTPIIKDLMRATTTHVVQRGTRENAVNLAPAFLSSIVAKYQGTRLGRQELNAEILEDNPDALWQRDQIEAQRVLKAPPLKRVVVAIDPSASSGEHSAETGIIAAGIGYDDHGYILADGSTRGTPNAWARAAVTAFHTHGADRLVYEANQGGEMVAATLHSVEAALPLKAVHASRGKQTRAEPVSALYEQSRVHHVGSFPALEDQMCEWVPGGSSPDRLDALVWALTELMLGAERQAWFVA